MEFAERVPAVLCADCGRIFATDAAVARADHYGASRIARVAPAARGAAERSTSLGSGGF